MLPATALFSILFRLIPDNFTCQVKYSWKLRSRRANVVAPSLQDVLNTNLLVLFCPENVLQENHLVLQVEPWLVPVNEKQK